MKKISLALATVGNRVYVDGNTFAIRKELKSIGCHWDEVKRQWWIGSAKKSELENLVRKFNGQEVAEQVDDFPVEGKVKYKGKTWYIIGSSFRSGPARRTLREISQNLLTDLRLHLASLDGKVHFWTDGENCELIKMYRSQDDNRKRKTLAQIREFIERIKHESPEEREARNMRKWAYETHGGICRCSRPLDEGDGSCIYCGYAILLPS